MTGFWLTPSCERIPCKHHHIPAVKAFPDLEPSEATEAMLRMGNIRCVISGDDLFYERRPAPSERQMNELKSIAMEGGFRLLDDKGKVVAHELPSWVKPSVE
jgi:hypothetical protein